MYNIVMKLCVICVNFKLSYRQFEKKNLQNLNVLIKVKSLFLFNVYLYMVIVKIYDLI